MNKKIRIGALISGSGTNLQAIIDGCERGTISGQMVFVGSDNPNAAGLERAKQSRIPIFVVDYASIIQSGKKSPQKLVPPPDFNLDEAISKQTFFGPNADAEKTASFLTTRAIAEAELLSRMAAFDADLLVLAGFMRNLTPYFIDRVNTDRSQPRIMNIHPAAMEIHFDTDVKSAGVPFILSITVKTPAPLSGSGHLILLKRTPWIRSERKA
jgi:phosphoribosylglycinamide formyltransferase-1